MIKVHDGHNNCQAIKKIIVATNGSLEVKLSQLSKELAGLNASLNLKNYHLYGPHVLFGALKPEQQD